MSLTTLPALAAFVLVLPLAAQETIFPADQLVDRIVLRENTLLQTFRSQAPLVETYIQEMTEGPGENAGLTKDHYFLGKIKIGAALEYVPLISRTDEIPKTRTWGPFRSSAKSQPMKFLPGGFAQMAFLDLHVFNRQTYAFEFVRREFLGDVRCLVFDVSPRGSGSGRFVGRIWVEDRAYSTVRFNGTYFAAAIKNAPPARYFHFDSWRVNVALDQWVPAQVYVEEEGSRIEGLTPVPRFKAQTRFWGYAAASARAMDELTSILVESGREVQDQAALKDVSPLESQRSWERQAEENVIERLESGGLLALPGPVDAMLDTVVHNLIFGANLNVDARCRVLLTTPMETFSIGHTIIISRGLIDVLPDETSLALILADELSHIALGHRTPTQFAFRNQTMLSDADLLERVHFERSPSELEAAGKKTIEIMRASPYKNIGNAGLFLKALGSRSSILPRLLVANLGNQVANAAALARLSEFIASAPELKEMQLDQIAALPLGSRIKVDPWNDRISLVKARPLELLSPREKMPFEITPVMLYLTRLP